MTQRNQADQDVEAGAVFVEITEKTGIPGSWILRAGRQPHLARARTAPGKKRMQLARPQDGGLVYTQSNLEVQNGNSA